MMAEGGRRKDAVASALPFLLVFVVGAVAVLGFAPFRLFPLPILTVALLLALWLRAGSPRAAAALGFAYGLAFFLAGASWVYVSLHEFGSMPAPLAALATFLFCAVLALFPALAGYACARTALPPPFALGLLAPAAWTLAEWTRGWIFTGFPWLALGYSQIPASPLAGYAPLLGIHGVTLAGALTAGLLVVLWQRVTARDEGPGDQRKRGLTFLVLPSAFCLLAIWLGGWALQQVRWTEPEGDPVTVSLLQGNISQELKWREDRVRTTLETYRTLAENAPGRLIVMPETALPLFLDQVPHEYLSSLAEHARKNGGDILIGVPERVPGGAYFNSVLSLGSAPAQGYRKSHLVPFGEFIPLRPVLGWIVGVLAIPLQDFSAGEATQRPLAVAGQRVAVNICYEDAFGEEIIRQLPEASLLVNVSNVAWFGRSIAPQQHLQISQARALETGRYMLRSTNTGVTATINPRGEVAAIAPEFTAAIVTDTVQGHRGLTPYARWGNYPALALCIALWAGAVVAGRRRRDTSRN